MFLACSVVVVFKASLKFLAKIAGYKVVITQLRFINPSNVGLRPQFLGLINLKFPSESCYNYYIFPSFFQLCM